MARLRRRPRGRSIRRCAFCGSTKITYESALITGQVFHCQHCGYVGPLVIEVEIPESPPAT